MKQSRKKNIVVRKNEERKIGVCVAVTGLLIAILILYLQNAYEAFALLCVPIALPLLAMLLYFETWKVSFSADRITKTVFFITFGDFSYSQIKDVVSSISRTEYEHVRITFTNGKQIVFRCDDENADKALNRIISRHSVRKIL